MIEISPALFCIMNFIINCHVTCVVIPMEILCHTKSCTRTGKLCRKPWYGSPAFRLSVIRIKARLMYLSDQIQILCGIFQCQFKFSSCNFFNRNISVDIIRCNIASIGRYIPFVLNFWHIFRNVCDKIKNISAFCTVVRVVYRTIQKSIYRRILRCIISGFRITHMNRYIVCRIIFYIYFIISCIAYWDFYCILLFFRIFQCSSFSSIYWLYRQFRCLIDFFCSIFLPCHKTMQRINDLAKAFSSTFIGYIFHIIGNTQSWHFAFVMYIQPLFGIPSISVFKGSFCFHTNIQPLESTLFQCKFIYSFLTAVVRLH